MFDLPETVRDEAALGERIEFVAGDFFERVPEGDVYVLSTILHDWDDEHATRILQTIRAAAQAGTRGSLVIESVVPPGNEPDGAKWLDMLMLALFAREGARRAAVARAARGRRLRAGEHRSRA